MPPDVLALKSPSSCSLNVTTVPRPCLPPELLDRIIALAMESRYGTPTSSLDSFAALASFTLASTALRHIALRRFFRHIILFSTSGDERAHWDAMFTILASLERNGLQCFEWVRSLRATSKALTFDPARLGALTHLEELSIDLKTEGLLTQQPFLKLLCRHISPSISDHKLTILTLTSLPRIDIPLLRLISGFSLLVDLHLSTTERLDFSCCWICLEESMGLTVHSPVPDMFLDSTCMADAFAKVLAPLIHLTHLHLGIYLSDEKIMESHVDHGEAASGFVFSPEDCYLCAEAASYVQLRELTASLALAQAIKTLQTIGFSSVVRASAGHDGYAVLRENDSVRVKKRLWPSRWWHND